jgi:hypothetical protein
MPGIGGVQCELCLKTAVPVMRKYLLGTDLMGDIFEEECQVRAAEWDRLRPVSRFKAARIRRWHSKDFAAIRELGHRPVPVWGRVGLHAGGRTWADEKPNLESPINVGGPARYGIVGLILIAAGLALSLWVWVEATQGSQPVYFVSTPGEIVSLSPGGPESVEDSSRIRVTVGGQEIEFRSVTYASDGLGKWVSVWYDPSDPAGTVQTEADRRNQHGLVQGASLAFVVIGVVFIYRWRKRYSPTHFEDKRPERAERKRQRVENRERRQQEMLENRERKQQEKRMLRPEDDQANPVADWLNHKTEPDDE